MRRLLFGILFFLALLGVLSACAASPPSYFAYREKAFSAEVAVRRGDLETRCVIEVAPTEAGYAVSVRYHAPTVLEELLLCATCRADGTPVGEVRVQYKGTESMRPVVEVQGLLQPATVWLTGDAFERVTHLDRGYRLELANGTALLLDDGGNPQTAQLTSAEFWIIWWENGKK